MSVIVDDQTIPAEQLGLTTLGQLLNHLQRDNRLVVHVLIDGQELATLMIRHRVGVRVKDVYEVRKIDENYFVE